MNEQNVKIFAEISIASSVGTATAFPILHSVKYEFDKVLCI